MGGLDQRAVNRPAVGAQVHQEAAVGLGRGHGIRPVVHLLKLHQIRGGIAAAVQPGGNRGGQFFVIDKIVPGKQHVFHGHGLAVGPAHALQQLEGEFRAVLVGGGNDHVAVDFAGVPVHGHHGFVHHDKQIRAPGNLAAHQLHGSAVISLLGSYVAGGSVVVDLRMQGQPFLHRGKNALFHQFGQHGRFRIGSLLRQGGGQKRQRQDGRQQQGEQSLHGIPPKKNVSLM